MSDNSNAKCKICRREGEKLHLKGERCASPKCAMIKKAYPPGMHGEKGGRMTEYGRQLRAKQKVKRLYGIRERQFARYYEESARQSGVTGDNLLFLLERRLDNVVHRLGFAPSRRSARQLVSHTAFEVNGKKVNVPSYSVKAGDVIRVRDSKQGNKYFSNLKKSLTNKNLPDWLSLDPKKLEAKIVSLPTKTDIDLSADMQLIVELYSR